MDPVVSLPDAQPESARMLAASKSPAPLVTVIVDRLAVASVRKIVCFDAVLEIIDMVRQVSGFDQACGTASTIFSLPAIFC